MSDTEYTAETKADLLGDWFRRIGTRLSDKDYEAGITAIAAHDAELTERVRAEQRETDARIGHDAAAEWVDGWQPNSHKNSRIEDCIAAAIREAGKQ